MNPSSLIDSLQGTLGTHIPTVFGALALFALGWLVAVMARAASRQFLAFLRVNGRIADSTGQQVDVESPISFAIFWLLILAALAAAFNALDLAMLSAPLAGLVDRFLSYLPNLIAGVTLVLVSWLLATILRTAAVRALAATSLDEKLATSAGMEPMSGTIGNTLFWLVILLFLPAVLSAFQLMGLLEPVQAMLTKLLDILPNIIGGFAIGLVGWLVGRVLSALISNLLLASGIDRMGRTAGLAEGIRLSKLAGTLVFILVFVPSLVAALDALKLEAISRPATQMLDQILGAVPNVIGAAAILVLTYLVARFASDLIARLLAGMGFDGVPEKLGLAQAFQVDTPPSRVVGGIAMFFAMLFATIEAANQLGFSQVRDLVSMFIRFGADVLLGAVILVIGFRLANLAYAAINRASGAQSAGMAHIARIAILGLVAAMGLRAMGIADDIVNMAFTLTLGAVAVAVALSFGLGGREAAGKQLDHWLGKLRDKK